MSRIKILFIFSIVSIRLTGQVGIGTNSPNKASILELQSNSKGVLIPRMSNLQMLNITNPPKSLLVFNIDSNSFYFYNGSFWKNVCEKTNQNIAISTGKGTIYLSNGGKVSLADSSNQNELQELSISKDSILLSKSSKNIKIPFEAYSWSLKGNRNTSSSVDFVGTLDSQALSIRTNNIQRAVIGANGNIGINTNTPARQLHVNGNIRLNPRTNNGHVPLAIATIDSVGDIHSNRQKLNINEGCSYDWGGFTISAGTSDSIDLPGPTNGYTLITSVKILTWCDNNSSPLCINFKRYAGSSYYSVAYSLNNSGFINSSSSSNTISFSNSCGTYDITCLLRPNTNTLVFSLATNSGIGGIYILNQSTHVVRVF